jgi:hypothetical protein
MIKGLLKQPGCQSVACSSQFLFKIKERCWKNMIKVLLKQPAHSTLDANVLLVHWKMKEWREKDERKKNYRNVFSWIKMNTVTSRSYINYNLWFKNPIIKEAINDKIYTQFLDYLLWIWFPLSLVSVISCADMIRDHDYLQCQWSLIMISSVSGIPDHAYLQYHYYPQWIWYYLQYQ